MSTPATPPAPSRAQLVELMVVRLEGAGWKATPCAAADRNAAVADLLPEPDEVLSLRNGSTGEQGQAALSFTQWNGRTSYACTIYRSDGDVVLERGHLDEQATGLQRVESRGELAADGHADASKPVASLVVEASPVIEERTVPPPARVVRRTRVAVSNPPAPPAPVEKKRPRAPLPARPADVSADANALSMILAAVQASGTYACRWAELRRHHFPGPDGWSRLKDWCATQSIECALSFVQSSKAADVQFRKPLAQP